MRVTVVDHPLIAHKLTTLRDERTDSPTFRRLTDELVTLLAYEATRDVRVAAGRGDDARWVRPSASGCPQPKPLVVPILRAGLGMLDGMVRILPTAEVGFLGLVRDEETLVATTYAHPAARRPVRAAVLPARPDAGHRRHAVGGRPLPDRARRRRHHGDLPARGARRAWRSWSARRPRCSAPFAVVTAALDERLNDRGYIVPGLGDAGDRLYGVV